MSLWLDLANPVPEFTEVLAEAGNEGQLSGEEISDVVRLPGQNLRHPHVAQFANQGLDLQKSFSHFRVRQAQNAGGLQEFCGSVGKLLSLDHSFPSLKCFGLLEGLEEG